MARIKSNLNVAVWLSWQKFRKEIQFEPFQNLFPNQSEKHFEYRSMEIHYKSDSIQINLKQVFTRNYSDLAIIRIDLDWKHGLDSWFGFIRTEVSDWTGISRIESDWFLTNTYRTWFEKLFILNKNLWEWFENIVQNISNSLVLSFFPKALPGQACVYRVIQYVWNATSAKAV